MTTKQDGAVNGRWNMAGGERGEESERLTNLDLDEHYRPKKRETTPTPTPTPTTQLSNSELREIQERERRKPLTENQRYHAEQARLARQRALDALEE